MRCINPPTCVDVERDGTWHRGYLSAWQRNETGWRAYVNYGPPGGKWLEWVPAERVRKVATPVGAKPPTA